MATYTDPTTINTNPDDPVTSEFGTAALDNPTAIAEGASGAPKIEAAALNMVLATGAATVTDLDRVDTLLMFAKVTATEPSTGTNTSIVRYRLSSDNGSSYSSYVDVARVDYVSGNANDGADMDWALIDISAHNAIQIDHEHSPGGGVSPGTATQSSFTLGVQGTSP